MMRRATRAIPWIGGALALLTLSGAIRRKGWIRGTAHTVLDFIPYVGTAKNIIEGLGGKLAVDSEPGVGTEILIDLPTTPPEVHQ